MNIWRRISTLVNWFCSGTIKEKYFKRGKCSQQAVWDGVLFKQNRCGMHLNAIKLRAVIDQISATAYNPKVLHYER